MKKLHYIPAYAKILSAALFLAVGSTSCTDILEKQPPSSISDGNFWTGEGDAKLALTGCYRFESGWGNDSFDHPQGILYLDLCGGHGSEKEGFTTLMAGSNTVATNSNLLNYWINAYEAIARQNTFLDNIGNCPMNEEKKAEWIAEVKTLRAFYFFQLAFYFNNVPMPLTSLTTEEANSIAQSSQAEVYAQIEKDLKEAIEDLPLEQKDANLGRLSKGAAQTLLARLYLAQNKYSEAATLFKSIINSNVYELERGYGAESYEKLFQVGGEKSKETIFPIMYHNNKFTTVRYIYQYPEVVGGWHQFAINNELVKEYFCTDGLSIEESPLYDDDDPYMNRDLRLYASIFLPPLGSYPGTEFKGQIYNSYRTDRDYYNQHSRANGYCPKKGADPSVSDLYSVYTYTPLIRYAEVLLSYLEAVNESAPSSVDQALLDLTINDIRDRVQLPPYAIADLNSQEAVRKAVRKERRVELALEGLRYFDVLRWGIASEELNRTFTGVKLSNDPNAQNYRGEGNSASPVDEDMYYQYETRTWSSHNRYFPIPQNDLNINKNLKQNDGYN